MSEALDPRTGRPMGDHGAASAAIDFALDHAGDDAFDKLAFLEAWREGGVADEWPEFYPWLVERERPVTSADVIGLLADPKIAAAVSERGGGRSA